MMKNENIFRYQPTPNGMRYTSTSSTDPERKIPFVLYPDNRRSLLFDAEQLQKTEKSPFRPVGLAKLSPQYELDMHCVSGMAGRGRIAVVKNGRTVWLDEFEHIETEYYNGEVRYSARDKRISEAPVKVVFIAGRGLCGLLIRIDTSEIEEEIELYYLHGGMLGWHTHSPFELDYSRDMCWGNTISISGDLAHVVLNEEESPLNYFGLKKIPADEGKMSGNRLWLSLENWKQQYYIHAEGASIHTAPPDAFSFFVPDHLRTASSGWGEIVCAKLPVGCAAYAAVGLGEAVKNGNFEKLFNDIRAENDAVANHLIVRTGNTEFDGAVTAAAFPTEGVYGDNVFLHGNLSWRDGYQGWRVAYGPIAYGFTDASAKHFENHFSTTLITEGPDKGAFCSTLEGANPSAIALYNMHQTFLHQARRYWESTGDKAFAERLLPIVEGCIERDTRRLKPGEEMLYENCLNTWISDHHWLTMAQCTQASAYLYNMNMLASELAEDPDKKAHYADQAESIRTDMNRVLWQERKGVYAYGQDMNGNKLLHTEPELGDVYHPVELGVTDMYQTYQMLDWAEANLQWHETDNGGRLCRSSNWQPNGGRKYSHSIYEINGGDELNLALAYQEIGLAEQGYSLFKSFYESLYGGRDPEIFDFNSHVYRYRGVPKIRPGVALDLPCHLSVNGTSRLNALFGDTIGMYGRELYEGILGVRPKLQNNEVWLTPCIPAEMPHLEMQSALMDYVYDRSENEIRMHYRMKREGCTLRPKLYLPVAQIESVKVNGMECGYTCESGFCGVTVTFAVESTSEGNFSVVFQKTDVLPVEPRRMLGEGEAIALKYQGELIRELIDPQHLLTEVTIREDCITARTAESEGSGVFFLKMLAGNTEYIRPVKVRIGEKKKRGLFRSFREEFDAPYQWNTVNMDALFNHASTMEAASGVTSTGKRPPDFYSQFNFDYYMSHVSFGFVDDNPPFVRSNERWKSLIDENGIAMTGEGIPFRSHSTGNCMAAATLVSPEYSDRITVPVGDDGRAVYLLITGTTFPMQSHVENLRILIRYEDGTAEEHPLYNPDDIGDMWFTKFGRYHDTPANGFENIGRGIGALSSAGMDLTKPLPTDQEAHILRFRLREGIRVSEIEMRVIANDVIFALMGITILK